MSLNIKNPEAYRLAKELARETGESMTEAVVTSLRERLNAIRRPSNVRGMLEDVREIQRFVASLPVLDSRSDEEIIGYDELGLPR